MSLKKLLKRNLIIAVISCLVVSALVGITVLLLGSFGDIEGRILLTTLAVGGFSITSLASLRTIDSINRLYVILAFATIAVSVAALLVVLGMIWIDYNYFAVEYPWKLALTLIILSVSLAHISLLLPFQAHIKTTVTVVITATVAFIVIVAGILITLVVNPDSFSDSELTYRLLGVFAILDVLGTIVSPILFKALTPKKG